MTIVDRKLGVDVVAPDQLESAAALQALFEEARTLRRKRRRRWGVALIAVIVVSIWVIVLLRHAQEGPGISGANEHSVRGTGLATVAMPKDMVVWRNFKIEVVASANGRLVRTLAPDQGLYRYVPSASVSPDGTVYFDEAPETTPGVPTEEILSVPLGGGPTSIVAEGHEPVVSPNGRLLAYLTYGDFSNAPASIVVRDLRSGRERTWHVSSNLLDINGLSWSPGSTHLAFTLIRPSADKQTLVFRSKVIDVAGPQIELDRATPIPLPQGMSFAGYINAKQGIGVVPRRDEIDPVRSSVQLRIVDVRSGSIVRKLPSVAGVLGVGNVSDGAEGTVQVDQSGHHLALVGVGSGTGALFRLNISSEGGDRTSPIHLANGVLSVAWGPR
jgi:hypothetical protein